MAVSPNWNISYAVSRELAWNVILSCSGSLVANPVTPLVSDDYKDVAVDDTGSVNETTSENLKADVQIQQKSQPQKI